MTDIRDYSEEYLEKFLNYCSLNNVRPIIVGGWAVYAFTQREKSVDIDLVLEQKADLVKIEPFFVETGFKKVFDMKGEVSFEKTSQIGENVFEFYFEIFQAKEKNAFKENKNFGVPWSLTKKQFVEVDFGKQKMLVPEIELLLFYKLKAYRDRTYKYYKEHSFTKQKERARQLEKIEKDKRDIQNLLATGKISQAKIEELSKQVKSFALLKETLEELT